MYWQIPHFQTQKLRLYINLMLTYEKNTETEYYSQWDKRNSQPAYPDLIYMWAMIFILLIPFRTKTTKLLNMNCNLPLINHLNNQHHCTRNLLIILSCLMAIENIRFTFESPNTTRLVNMHSFQINKSCPSFLCCYRKIRMTSGNIA